MNHTTLDHDGKGPRIGGLEYEQTRAAALADRTHLAPHLARADDGIHDACDACDSAGALATRLPNGCPP